MEPWRKPLLVRPQVYALMTGVFLWCKLSDVCKIVPVLAAAHGHLFTPSPEELVNLFAQATRPNHSSGGGKRLKLFRYVRSSRRGFEMTEVPPNHVAQVPFHLDCGVPYSNRIFVTAGWAFDTLEAVGGGATYAIEIDGRRYGVNATKNEMIQIGTPTFRPGKLI